ncbi:hypothetical protein BJ508DRAFT_366389 [Ascobolus immersus RN42]|uniref:Uncharacterized protein n=1 Tax=Ascobolus immersus RN42 TaxID=1160509 RepID=A0A3N4HQ13_ASCIM|nr:hypothetical protein BJ508DRAFT_366389 [Ascobolus immersus RN42]
MSAPPSPNKGNGNTPPGDGSNGNNNNNDRQSSEGASVTSPKTKKKQQREARIPYALEEDFAMRYYRDDLESDWNTVLQLYTTLARSRGWPERSIAGLQSRYYRVIAKVTGQPAKEVKAANKDKKSKGNRTYAVSTMHRNVWYIWMGGVDPNGGEDWTWELEGYSDIENEDDEDWELDSNEAGPSRAREERSESRSDPARSSPEDTDMAMEHDQDDADHYGVIGKGKGRAQ